MLQIYMLVIKVKVLLHMNPSHEIREKLGVLMYIYIKYTIKVKYIYKTKYVGVNRCRIKPSPDSDKYVTNKRK